MTPLQPVTVRVHYVCRHEVERPLFSFAVTNEHGVYVSNPGMRPASVPGLLDVGEGYVDYVIERLPLGEGEYRFSFAVHDAHATMAIDKRDDLISLRVRNGDEYVAGLVDLTGTWGTYSSRQEDVS